MQSHTPCGQRLLPVLVAIAALGAAAALPAHASSHREAPAITGTPKVDATDFYMFNSYEAGREAFVTLVANYLPLQDPYGGPNYFKLDANALYEIHVDNNGDANEDITFQFRFTNALRAKTLPINGVNVAIPLTQFGQVANPNDASLNVNESFTLDVIRGDRRSGTRSSVTKTTGGGATFDKPADNIGMKTIPDYAGYAAKHIYSINIPGCASPGKVFVGQRKDPFAVNLGAIFDLVNVPGVADFSPAEAAFLLNPANKNAGMDDLADKNVTTLALEVPKDCLTGSADKIIGGWTTASLRQGRLLNSAPPPGYDNAAVTGGAWVQVSRLGMPLVNEVVIGLPDKDKFNSSQPKGDGQFLTYVTNPTLPALLEIALATPNIAPKNFPRNDLVTTFLTGIKGLNQPTTFTASEMLRLNTAIPAVPEAMQNRLGIVGNVLAKGSDNAGYPNGRRPKDDVVDISLVAVMGGLCVANGPGTTNALLLGTACNAESVPLGTAVFGLHDAVDQATITLLPIFPYLNTPIPGAK